MEKIATSVDFQPLPEGDVLIEFFGDDGKTLNKQVVTPSVIKNMPLVAVLTEVALAKGSEVASEQLPGETPTMPITIDKEKCRQDGFSDSEIAWIERYCNARAKHGLFSDLPAIICIGPFDPAKVMIVCKTVAEAIDALRPGAWLRAESDQFIDYLKSRGEQEGTDHQGAQEFQ